MQWKFSRRISMLETATSLFKYHLIRHWLHIEKATILVAQLHSGFFERKSLESRLCHSAMLCNPLGLVTSCLR